MVISEKEFDEQLRKIQKDRPEKQVRDDIRLRGLAHDLGWEVLYGNDFGDSLMFRKGTKTIYYCSRGWRCGDSAVNSPTTRAIDRVYHDYDNLEKALGTER